MRPRSFAAAICLTLLVAVACTQQPPPSATPTPSPTGSPAATQTPEAPPPTLSGPCSANGLSADVPDQPLLKPEVLALRKEIVRAAVACDFNALAQLALKPDNKFQVSSNPADTTPPATFWLRGEAAGEPVLATLVKVLNAPAAIGQPGPEVEQVVHIWPSAASSAPADSDWDAAKSVYPPNQIAAWKAAGRYAGYRALITIDGDWTAYFSG